MRVIWFCLRCALQWRHCPAGRPRRRVNVDEIIRKFAAKEAEFAKARENYTYRQTVKIQELDPSGGRSAASRRMVDGHHLLAGWQARGEGRARPGFDSARTSSLTPDDEPDLRNVQPFVLTTTRDSRVRHSAIWARKKSTRSAATLSRSSPRRWRRASAISRARSGSMTGTCRS